jgi:PAS domain-containing protein
MDFRARFIRIDEFGKPMYISGIIIDNNDYKKTVDALIESEERYRGLYQNIPIGMYRTTPDGNILMANNALVEMHGLHSLEELQRTKS